MDILNRMTGTNKIFLLNPIGTIDENILKHLKEGIEDIFSFSEISVQISKSILPLRKTEYNQTRGQYDGSKVIRRLLNQEYKKDVFRVLGIMDEDLYSGNLNFIFGLATTSKSAPNELYVAALISIIRLREAFYGNAENQELFKERALKEAIHELGHTFGLGHCNNNCIMRFSNHLGQTDDKPLEFCDWCMIKLRNYFGP